MGGYSTIAEHRFLPATTVEGPVLGLERFNDVPPDKRVVANVQHPSIWLVTHSASDKYQRKFSVCTYLAKILCSSLSSGSFAVNNPTNLPTALVDVESWDQRGKFVGAL